MLARSEVAARPQEAQSGRGASIRLMRMATLALTGDVMLGRGVNDTLRVARPAEPWGDVLPLLLAADLRLINLECAITVQSDRGRAPQGLPLPRRPAGRRGPRGGARERLFAGQQPHPRLRGEGLARHPGTPRSRRHPVRWGRTQPGGPRGLSSSWVGSR